MKHARVENIEDYYLLKGALDGGHLTDSSLESKAQDILESFERQGHAEHGTGAEKQRGGGSAGKRTRIEQ